MGKYLFLLAFFSSPAMAFTFLLGPQNQVATGWSGGTVTFDIDSSCAAYIDKVYSAIETAKNTWGAVPTSSLKVERGSIVTLAQPITTYVGASATSYAPAGNTVIYCDANFGADAGVNANNIPGFAVGQNFKSDGQLIGGLLVLNVQAGAS